MTEETSQNNPPRAWINTIRFSDGKTVTLSQNDIVVLVGPNNAGKSAALKDIFKKAKNKQDIGLVVQEAEIQNIGTNEALIQWLQRTCRRTTQNPSNPQYTRLGKSVSEQQAKNFWQNSSSGLKELSSFLVYHLTTDARLSAANPAPNIALTRDPITHPIHYLQMDDSIEKKASAFFREAFGEELLVHRNAGKEVPLLCGESPHLEEGEDRVSLSYLRRLEALPALNEQGDGMRSFVGVLLHALVVDHPVTLIDEPEAFLHPPQARLMGQMLVKEAPEDRQLFVATHSSDFLRGLLDSDSKRVRVIRVQRSGDINPIKELDNKGVRDVWGDPILRYSNVLDGLFHSKVIVCESDADCRFYAAIMDAISSSTVDTRRDHVMFIHCGGKDRIPVVVDALKNLDVPVNVICDFDVLNAEKPLCDICVAIGIEWEEIKGYWKTVKTAVDDKKPDLETKEVDKEIRLILDSVNEKYFPKHAKKQIYDILRRSSPWSSAKTTGKSFVPSGQPSEALQSLFQFLEAEGIFVVPVGELEGFCRTVGNHGPKWVNEVLQKDLANDPRLSEARDFVTKIISHS